MKYGLMLVCVLMMTRVYGMEQEVEKYRKEIVALQGNDTRFEPSIFKAIKSGDIKQVTQELSNDPTLLEKSFDGDTLLSYAVWFEKTAIARYLIEQGADVHCLISGCLTLLDYARLYHKDLVTLLK